MSSVIPEGATGPGPEDHSEYVPAGQSQLSENSDGGPELTYSEPSSTQPQTPAAPPQDQAGINPAWNTYREKLPESLFNEIRPELEKQDKYIQQVQQQFAPYKTFVDQGVAPDTLQRAIQLAQVINANPRAVWESLNARYNFGAEASQGQQESQEENQDDDEDVYDPDAPIDPATIDLSQNPQFQAWQQQVQAQEQWRQQVETEQLNRQIESEITAQWNEVNRLNGTPLSPQEQTEVIRRATWIADMKDQQTGKYGFHEPDLREGFKDYQQFIAQARATRANNTAPSVLGGTGGLPATPKGITADMSDDERIAYIAERARQLKEAND